MAGLRDLQISTRRSIAERFLSVRVSRSSGPGGQHVNTTNSRVDLRVDFVGAGVFSEAEVEKLREKLGSRLDGDGLLQVVSDTHRSQLRNTEDACARAEELIKVALRPVKKRRATKPTKGSQKRRLDEKSKRGAVKKDRRTKSWD